MIPQQQRAVDPFSSYESDNVNRISRIITSGEDRIVRDSDLYPTYVSQTLISISSGVAIKDDVTIHFPSASIIDLTDAENYSPSSTNPTPNIFEFWGYWPGDLVNSRAYVVLEYEYQKISTPPEAQFKILKDPNDFTTDKYMFLGMVYFSAAQTIVNPLVYIDTIPNPDVERQVANLQDAYTDSDARAADALNPITNHLPANNVGGYDRNKAVVTGTNSDSPPGKIKLVNFGYIASRITNDARTWVGSPLVVNHTLDLYPQVQVVEASSGEFVEAIIDQISTSQFTVDFDFSDSDPGFTGPYEVVILY